MLVWLVVVCGCVVGSVYVRWGLGCSGVPEGKVLVRRVVNV